MVHTLGWNWYVELCSNFCWCSPSGGDTLEASQPGQIIISVSFYMDPLDNYF